MISSIPSNNTPSSGVEPITTTTSSMSLEFNPIIASSHNNTSRTQSSPQQPPSSPLSAAIDSNDKTTTTTDPINSNELSELLLGIYMRNAIQSSVKRKVEEIAMDKTTANALSFHYKKRQGLVRTDLEKKSINNTNGGALDGMVSTTTTTTIPLLIQESISNDHSIVSTLNAPSTNLFCASSIHDLTTTTVIEKNTSSNTTSMLDNSRGNHDNSTSVSDDKKVPMAFSTMTNTDNNETDSETEAEKFTRTFMEDYVNDDLIVNKDEEANIVPVNVKDYVMDHFRKTILLEWDNYKRSTQFKYEWIETRIKHLQQEYNYILDLLQEKHSLIHSNSDQSSDNISETFNGDTFKPSTLLQETLLSPAKRRNDFMQHPFFSSFEEFFNRELEHFRQLKEKQSDLATISSHWLSAAAGGASSVVRQQVASDTNTMVDESVTSAVAPPSDMTTTTMPTTTMPTTTTAAPTMMTSSSNKPQAAATTTTTQLHSSMSALSPTASSLSIITLNLNCHPGSSLPLTSPQTSKIMYPLPYITSADILDSLQLIYNPNTSYSNYPLPRRTYPLSFSNIMNQYNKKKKRVGSSRRSTSIRSVAGFRRSRGAEDNPTEDIVIFDTGVSNIKDIKYKEIVTPSFRVLTNEELSQLPTINETEEEEDISDARYCYLHIDNEMQERQKYYLASLPTTDKKKKKSQADEEEEIRKTMKYQVPSYETIVEAFESFKSKRSEEQSSTTTTTEICHPKPPVHKFSENFTYLVPKDQMVSGSTSSSTCATPTSSKTTLMNAKLAYTSQSSTTSLTSPQKKQKDKKTADQSVIPRWKLITLESYVPYPIAPCEDPRGNWEELKFKSRERMQSLSLSVDTPILNPTTTTTMTLPSVEDDISRKRGVGQSSLLEEDEVMIETNDYDLASNTLNTETTLRTYASLNQSNSANRKRKKPPTSIDDDTLIALSEDDEDDVDYRDSLRKKSLNRDSDEDADDEDYIESRDRKKNKSSTTGSGYTSSHSRGKKRGPGRPKSTETTECTATSFVADRIYDTKIVLKLNGGGSVDTSSKEKKQSSSSSNGKNKKHHK
ncbi:hypothetical protein C9374_014017 [Naegleria lovaniensis]|uniref:PEHE domain-containing protein n=1 Tax=Naegleria lovaniensis TaxID=51637 RepID=A0AA88KUW2_NAELO|nr:uncharacterized protein C9374_014017 [Naegleria lovaniensis]KAG2389457.1 hypothetical protein C9374_014017 [Naegleria lovaniensis]